MAAIAQSELYENLIRRIGYSVGLEFLMERVGDLAELYISRGTVDGADWRNLVQIKWGRAAPAEQHIADVYAQLELLRRHNNIIQVLPTLDVLSILIKGSLPQLGESKPTDSKEILRFVLTMKILEADGDIFLNALTSSFQPREFGSRLQALVRHKRSTISPFFKQAGNIRRIMDAVSIRNQGDLTEKGKKLTYAQRSRLPMGSGFRGALLPAHWYEERVAISDDYLEKACVTRSGWAEELGFYERRKGVVTLDGRQLLDGLRLIGLEVKSPAGLNLFAFWPYGFQLRRMRLPPQDAGVPDLMPWDVLRAVAGTLGRRAGNAPLEFYDQIDLNREVWLSLLERTYELYRGSSRRGMIRHDLPLFIAETVLAFWLSRVSRALPDFRAFLRTEIKRPDRMLDLVMIHGTEGGLRLMRNEGGRRGVGA